MIQTDTRAKTPGVYLLRNKPNQGRSGLLAVRLAERLYRQRYVPQPNSNTLEPRVITTMPLLTAQARQ